MWAEMVMLLLSTAKTKFTGEKASRLVKKRKKEQAGRSLRNLSLAS
jgi:hypothetical protein